MVCLQVFELFQEFFFHKMIDEIFDGFQVMYRPGSCYLCIDDLLDCESVVLCITHLLTRWYDTLRVTGPTLTIIRQSP